jgi:NAD(P)-dependent dehydrogenase (short-subunit alcohol dehydrogenase family)
VVRADTSDPTAIEDLFTRVEERFGAIDVLFVNAGVARFAPIDQVDAGHLDDQFAVNFRGAYFTIQRALPLVRDGGSIILNTSVVNRKGLPNTSIYAATKAALRSLARTLSAELMPRQIRVNAVSPGPIETSIYGKLGLAKADLDAFAAAVKDQVPLGRFGAPEEVARAALFLASSDSSYVVGAEIATDGGMSQL